LGKKISSRVTAPEHITTFIVLHKSIKSIFFFDFQVLLITIMSINFFFEEFPKQPNNANPISRPKGQKIKRPMNAFLLYHCDMRKTRNIRKLKVHCSQLSKIIGIMWNKETEEVRMKYQKMAEQVAILHRLEHPDYRYSPETKKERQTDAMTSDSAAVQSNQHAYEPLPIENIDKSPTHRVYSEIPGIHNESNTEPADTFHQNNLFSTATLPSSVLDDIHIYIDGTHLDSLSLSLVREIEFVSLK
jgi:hypothetical protein